MKKATIILALLVTAMMISCSQNEQNQENQQNANICEEQQLWDSLVAIQDCNQKMSAELFAGQNDELLNKILPDGQADASINVFMLKGKDKMVLFDAGLGEERNGQLLAKLDSLGIKAEQITDICITHFHGDHIGGLLTANGEAVFKNAKLHFSDLELEAWTTGPLQERNEQVNNMLTAYADRYETFHAGDTIVEGIVTIAAPGHTPGHTLFDTGDEIIVGDLLHAVALQIEHPEFSAKYDFEPELATQTRISVLEIARTSHKPLAGMHFPAPFIIKL